MNKPNNLDEDSNACFKKKYKVKGLVEDNPKLRRKISNYMKEVVIQNMKDQGIYSETEDDIDEDKYEEYSNETSKYENY